MKVQFNYNGSEFIIDPAQHTITIDGKAATGKFAPLGAIIVYIDPEKPESCKVVTDAEDTPIDKTIIYGVPLAVGDKVLILDKYVIPADLFTRNDLEGDYEVYSEQLRLKAEKYIAECKKYYDNTKALYDEINSYFKKEVVELTEILIGKTAAAAEQIAGEVTGV